MNGFAVRYFDSAYAYGGERSTWERRVADSTLLRPDRSRPYPSIGALPDQRTFHTGDGTPAALRSQPRTLSVSSRVEVPVLQLIKRGDVGSCWRLHPATRAARAVGSREIRGNARECEGS